MWNMKKLRKKAGAVVLASALLTSLVSPFSVLAEEETVEGKTVVEEQNELAMDAEGKENEQLVSNLKSEYEEKETKKEDFESGEKDTSIDEVTSSEKIVGQFSYSYLDKNGVWRTEEKTVSLDKNTSVDRVVEIAKAYRVEDGMPGMIFKHWEMTFNGITDPIEDVVQASFEAVYDNSKIVTVYRSYYDETGEEVCVGETESVAEGTTSAQVLKKAIAKELPNMYEGLQFEKWSYNESYMNEEPIEENRLEIWLDAKYKNHIVSYWLVESEEDLRKLWSEADASVIKAKKRVVEDAPITLTTMIDNYEVQKYYVYREWLDGPGYEEIPSGTYEVTDDGVCVDFIVVGTKKDLPVDPEKPNKPTNPGKPQKPVVELPQNIIDQRVEQINKGENVHIQMGEATVVPKEILEAAKGKDVEIKLNMGDYTWTINGKDINANTLKDINLEVKVNSNAIPGKIVQAFVGNNPTCQISLTHNGPFGFKAELTVNVGVANCGKFGNLYYYDSDGKMIYRNTGKVDANGNVTLTFNHASDYLIVLSDKQMSQADVPSALQPTDANKNETVKTGDTAPVYILTILAIISLCTVILALRRKMTR